MPPQASTVDLFPRHGGEVPPAQRPPACAHIVLLDYTDGRTKSGDVGWRYLCNSRLVR